MPDELSAKAEALTGEVAGLRTATDRLGERIAGLREDFGKLADRQSTSERRGVFVAAMLVIAIALTALIGVVAWRGIVTDRRVDAICPVLALAIGGYDPTTRPEGDARDRYVASFEVMRQSYAGLGCTSPIVPPRKPN